MNANCNDRPLRIGLIGAKGKMGQAILLASPPSFSITPFNRSHPPHIGAHLDVFIDVSSKEALSQNLGAALEDETPIVIGTTGHENLDPLKEAAHSVPVFYSPNFSLGMALMRRAAADIAKKFHRTAQLQILESHHRHKKDAPSGSALMLAQTIELHHPAKVAIQSIREGEILGRHEVSFLSDEEDLVVIHEAKSRRAFAKGALLAASFLAVQSPGFYTMDDLIK